MNKPRIEGKNWVLSQGYIASDGEELWNLTPNDGDWSAVIHLEKNGKMYLKLYKKCGLVDDCILISAFRALGKKVYKERGVQVSIGVVDNQGLFRIIRKAGFDNSGTVYKTRKRKLVVVLTYIPDDKKTKKTKYKKYT